MTEPYGYKSTFKLFEMENPPSAILSSSKIIAMGIRRTLEEKNLK